jgi:serine protease Do
MTVHYYVVDRHANSYLKSTFDATERQQFTVAYNLHENDADRAQHLARAGTEKDVAAWEDQPMRVQLSWLLDDYVRNADKMRRLPTLTALRDEMLRDKNTALARVEANTFKASTQSDPRFDSVVAVYTARGLGSGFYVAPDVVMTNYHVVESARYVEMKLHGGQETFGRTIAIDPHRDLALVRVQARGQPVRFYARNTLDLGRTIDVIGHPRQLEFSITRGVISAVRKHKSVNIPGARELQVIQTDAAASPGNSGGPWFLGDEVIAVTSFGRGDRGSQNLNFGVHYAEALAFMRENDIQPLTR